MEIFSSAGVLCVSRSDFVRSGSLRLHGCLLLLQTHAGTLLHMWQFGTFLSKRPVLYQNEARGPPFLEKCDMCNQHALGFPTYIRLDRKFIEECGASRFWASIRALSASPHDDQVVFLQCGAGACSKWSCPCHYRLFVGCNNARHANA